jgi:rhamnosyltransferase
VITTLLPKVAILMAAFNGEKYIKEQLDTILDQEGINLTLFISVDCSCDDTVLIVQGYQEKYPTQIKLLPYGKRFGSAGQNFFRLLLEVDFNHFDYVAFADQDDLWSPHKISAAIETLRASRFDAYSSNAYAFWPNGTRKLIKKSYDQVEFEYLFESPGPGCTFVFTNELAFEIKALLSKKENYLDTLWLHDWFCYSFARTNGYKWVIDKHSYIEYRQHEDNSVGANAGFRSFYVRVLTVLKGGAFLKVKAQSEFIENTELPIVLLNNKTLVSMCKLALLSFKCRRKLLDKVFFLIVCILFIFRKAISKHEK